MLSLFQFILKVKPKKSQVETREAIGGMSMIELLVGTVIAFLIITPLMGFVLGLLNDDSRESAKATTEQELQSALDFIAEDLSQAIYVYDNTGVTELKKTQLPTTGDPILVFWKRQIMKESIPTVSTNKPKDCTASTTSTASNCNDSYVLSLVAYYLTDGNGGVCKTPNTNCEIIRYQVHDGLKNPYKGNELYPDADVKDSQKQRAAFNSLFDFSFSTPNVNVTSGAAYFDPPPPPVGTCAGQGPPRCNDARHQHAATACGHIAGQLAELRRGRAAVRQQRDGRLPSRRPCRSGRRRRNARREHALRRRDDRGESDLIVAAPLGRADHGHGGVSERGHAAFLRHPEARDLRRCGV